MSVTPEWLTLEVVVGRPAANFKPQIRAFLHFEPDVAAKLAELGQATANSVAGRAAAMFRHAMETKFSGTWEVHGRAVWLAPSAGNPVYPKTEEMEHLKEIVDSLQTSPESDSDSLLSHWTLMNAALRAIYIEHQDVHLSSKEIAARSFERNRFTETPVPVYFLVTPVSPDRPVTSDLALADLKLRASAGHHSMGNKGNINWQRRTATWWVGASNAGQYEIHEIPSSATLVQALMRSSDAEARSLMQAELFDSAAQAIALERSAQSFGPSFD